LVTKAKRGDLHSRRQVMTVVRDKRGDWKPQFWHAKMVRGLAIAAL
jgi:ribosomal protein L17